MKKNFLKTIGKSMKKKKVWIPTAVIAAAAVTGSAIYVNTRSVKGETSSETQISSAEATVGTLTNSIEGTGTLESGTGDSIKVPSSLIYDEVCVSEGDEVTAGDVLAKVDHASVLSAITDVQEKIDEIDAELEDAQDDTSEETITAGVSGTVTAVYISDGDDVAAIMQEKGTIIDIAVGGDTSEIVNVTAASGTVESVAVEAGDEVDSGDTLCTLTSDSASVEYQELSEDRSALVSELQSLITISQTDTITATQTGTIAEVGISTEEDSGSSGTTSTTSTSSAASTTTSSDGTETAAVLADYVTYTAISDEEAAELTSCASSDQETESTGTDTESESVVLADEETGSTEQSEISELTASGTASAETTSEDQTISFSIVQSEEYRGSANLYVTAPVTGATAQTTVQAADGSWSGTVDWKMTGTTFEAGTSYTAIITMNAADGYRFTSDSITGGSYDSYKIYDDGKTMIVTITFPATASDESSESSDDSSDESTSSTASDTTSGNTSGSTSSGNTGSSGSGTGSSTSSASGSASTSSGSSSDTSASSSTDETDTEDSTSYESDLVKAFTYMDEDTMSLEVSVDELDINSVEVDQSAEITLDALEDQTLEGTVTDVAQTASSSGNGSAKYTVTISVPKEDGMKVGMSASATIVIEESDENAILIPVNAIQEEGNSTYVYTETDEDGNLSGKTEVTTGLSDGDQVVITDGLSEGDTVYYEKTGNISSSSGNQSGTPGSDGSTMPSMGDNSGGQAPSGGQMPSGGQAPGGTQSQN